MQRQKKTKGTTRKSVNVQKEDTGTGSGETNQKALPKNNNGMVPPSPVDSNGRRSTVDLDVRQKEPSLQGVPIKTKTRTKKARRPRHKTSVITAEEADASRGYRTRRSGLIHTMETREDDQEETQQDDLSRKNLHRRKTSSRRVLNDNYPSGKKHIRRPVITLGTDIGSDGITNNDAAVTAEAKEERETPEIPPETPDGKSTALTVNDGNNLLDVGPEPAKMRKKKSRSRMKISGEKQKNSKQRKYKRSSALPELMNEMAEAMHEDLEKFSAKKASKRTCREDTEVMEDKKGGPEVDARPKEREIDPAELEKIDFFHYYLSRDDYYTILNDDGDFLIAYNLEKKKQVDLVVRSEQEIKTFPLIYNSDGYSVDGKHPQYTIPAYLKYLTNEKVNLDDETVIVTPQRRKAWIFEEQKSCVIHDKKPLKGKDYLIFSGEIKTRGRSQNVYIKRSRNFNAQFLEEISQEHRLFRHFINWSPFAIEVIGYCASHSGVGLILERDDGIRLSDFIEKSSVTKVQKKLFCFDAAIAVCFLHLSNDGIVHGAIQPENFVVDKKFMMAKITNFKHSFALPERRIANFDRIPPVRLKYCSPEVAREGWSKASDVWSLGITIWMLLNGMSKNPLAALSRGLPSQLETDPKLRPVLEGHGDSWKTLFDQMTSINPNDRPNVQFVAQRLKKIIDRPVGLRFEEDGTLCDHLGAVMFPESYSAIQKKSDKKGSSRSTRPGWKAKWGAEV